MPSSAVLAKYFHARTQRLILGHDSWTRAQVARLQSGGQNGAGLWLRVIPSLPCFRSPPELQLAMLMSRLQLVWQGAECVKVCRGTYDKGRVCGLTASRTDAIDPNHYMFQCKGRNRHVGHNAITKIVAAMYKQLGVLTVKEAPGLVEGQERPADVLVIPAVCHGAALPVALDVGGTDPGKDGAVHHGSWHVPKGALKAAEIYTNEKLKLFEKVKVLNPVLGFEYRPIVFETTSARGTEAEKWWKEITGLAKDKESGFALGYGALMEYNGLAYAWSGQTYARHWGMRLSLALMQSTHRYGLGRISEYTLLGGRRQKARGDRDEH